MKKTILSEKIRNLADSNGIDAFGFAEASEFKDYLLNRSKRRDPKLSLTDAKTIIAVGIHIGGSTGSRVSRKKPQTMTSSRT